MTHRYNTGVPTAIIKSLKEIELHTQDIICKVLMTSTESYDPNLSPNPNPNPDP